MSNQSIDLKIESFTNYYKHFVKSVESLQSVECEKILRKLAFVAIIDANAKVIFPKQRNYKRFTNIIREFGNWSNANKVSLPYLQAFLLKTPDPEFEDLRLFVNSEIAQWPSSSFVSLDKDSDYKIIQRNWPKDKKQDQLEQLRHVDIFYKYRNLLVHEFRQQSDPLDSDSEEYPIYFSELNLPDFDLKRWQLFYPTVFFQKLANNIIENVGVYLRKNKLDPTLQFDTIEYLVSGLDE